MIDRLNADAQRYRLMRAVFGGVLLKLMGDKSSKRTRADQVDSLVDSILEKPEVLRDRRSQD